MTVSSSPFGAMIARRPAISLEVGINAAGDRGYDADWIRALVRQRGAWANIPPRSNRTEPISFSPYRYRARNLVERFFNKIKHCRRVATRYDKLAANYLAFVQLESIRLWLRVNESTSLVTSVCDSLTPRAVCSTPSRRRCSPDGAERLTRAHSASTSRAA